MPETAKFSELRAALSRCCADKGRTLSKWRSRGNRSAHVLEVGGEQPSLLYVKDSALASGWWGVNRNVYGSLQSSGRDWRLVLLVRGAEEGYLFTSSQVAA